MAGGISSLRRPQNRKWRIAIFSAVLCLAAWIVWRIADDEPRYQGHGLWHWHELCNSTNKTEEAIGEQAIRSMGTNAVPYLIKVLERWPSKLDYWSWQISYRLPKHVTWRPRDRNDVAEVLSIIGTNAVTAVPALIQSMQHHYAGAGAPAPESMTVAMIGPQALPAVIQALTNANENIRSNASRSLNNFFWFNNTQPQHEECSNILLDALLTHPNAEVRKDILRAFKYHNDNSNSIPALSQRFKTCTPNSFPALLEILLNCRNDDKKKAAQDLQNLREKIDPEKQAMMDAAIQLLLSESGTNKPHTLP